ncbi:hypothetical protein [Actinoplanes sp. NPDC026619]|uniref:hypothetical protein n=1 Tax=Actinoplanes sp. NPDC026619 TaxID=3155798 RepID=UPI0033E4F58B
MTTTPDAADDLRRLASAAQAGDAAAQLQLAEALFRSALQPTGYPSPLEIHAAIQAEIAFGDTPSRAPADATDERMRWCRNVVALTFCGDSGPAAAADTELSYLHDLFWRRA